MKSITPEELDPADVLILDVRSPEEYVRAHIPGSVLHPLEELDGAAVRAIANDARPMVLVCERGARAEEGVARLHEAGLGEARVLEGGLEAWDRAGRPVRRSGARLSLERQIRIGAGLLVVIGFALAASVNPAWLALPVFVGCGLIFAGVTGFCGMGVILSRMPWNRPDASAACGQAGRCG